MKLVNKRAYGLPIMAVILSLGILLSSIAVVIGLGRIKTAQNAVTVTGSAKKQIKSDLVTWKGTYNVASPELAEAYNMLSQSSKKVKNYLVKKGIPEKDIIFSSIITNTNYIMNGYQQTSKVDSYKLSQDVDIRSNDIDRITTISRESTELINDGINFQSNPPEYLFTKIADLKVDMLGLATKDAKNRAEQIANNTGAKIGAIRSANMGVFQITPLYSTNVSDSGINDTTSIDKEITAVVSCNFEIK